MSRSDGDMILEKQGEVCDGGSFDEGNERCIENTEGSWLSSGTREPDSESEAAEFFTLSSAFFRTHISVIFHSDHSHFRSHRYSRFQSLQDLGSRRSGPRGDLKDSSGIDG